MAYRFEWNKVYWIQKQGLFPLFSFLFGGEGEDELTSREIFGQYEASRIRRCTHVWAIPPRVSSLTQEQLDISKDSKSGHDVTAERIAASESLWQEAISSSRKSGQLRTACGILLRFRDKVSSWGHLKKLQLINTGRVNEELEIGNGII